MSTRRFAVFGFASTHDAVRAERLVREALADAALIPAPGALGSLCGLALRVSVAEREAVASLLAQRGIVPNGPIEIDDRVLD